VRPILTLSILTVALVVVAGRGSAFPATPEAGGTPIACPITKPNGNNPPNAPPIAGGYGNDALWTNLAMWSEQPGIVDVPNDSHLADDGSVNEMKWAWWRYVPGRLSIEGHRLDAPAPPLEAEIPEGYGDLGFQVSGITFPTDGCWEVTGHAGDEGSLTFVVRVVYPEGFTPIATPVSSA
jgi:hypothetical protein